MQVIVLIILTAATAFAQPENPVDLPDSLYRDLLPLLCPGHAVISAGRKGCNVCPEGTGHASVEFNSDVSLGVEGRFEQSEERQVILAMNGCEPMSRTGADTYIFRKGKAGWTWTVEQGGAYGTCWKLTTPGKRRDVLLCYQGWTWMGSYSVRLVLYGRSSLLQGGGSNAHCFSPGSPIHDSHISVPRVAVAANGAVTVSVTAECHRGRVVCKGGEELSKPSVTSFRIEYALTEKGFAVTPATAQAVAAYQTCARD